MRVSILSMVFIIMNMAIGVVIPIVLAVFIRKKYKSDIRPFFIGMLTMFVFANVLEQIVHFIVLGSDAGVSIQNNSLLFALYGALMAGLFEETGRLFSMSMLLKKQHNNKYNSLMFGAGHGGFEMFLILVISNINNLIYGVMINLGLTETLMAPLDDATRGILQDALSRLAQTSPLMFLLSPVERFAALVAQIALSVIVWYAVTHSGKKIYYLLAIGLHFMLDFVAVLLSGFEVPIVLIEAVIWIMAILISVLAIKVWKSDEAEEGVSV